MLGLLQSAGIEAQGVKRGLDHGVWASFKCGMCTEQRNGVTTVTDSVLQPLIPS